jgi:hypothetical protein
MRKAHPTPNASESQTSIEFTLCLDEIMYSSLVIDHFS